MTDSLFDPVETDQPQVDPEKNYLQDLVGPGKKFKDVESLAKGKWFADQMVEIQNRKIDQMRTDYLAMKADNDARASIEELLTRMEKPEVPAQIPQEKPDNAPRITPEQIDEIVNRRISETKIADKAQSNFNTVMGKLKERFGTNYQEVLREQTNDLGLTVDDVNALARKSPEAFFRTMGLDVQPQTSPNQAPPRNTQMLSNKTSTPKKTWSYYQDLYKKNPKLYYDPKMTQEMVQSHAELGTEFEDGDFRVFGDTLNR